MPVGSVMMILAAPPVLEASGWTGLWLALAGLTALWLAVVAGTAKSGGGVRVGNADVEPLWRNLRLGMSRVGPFLVALSFGLYAAQFYAIMAWLPTFLIEERGMATAPAAALTAVVIAGNAIGSFVGAGVLRRNVPAWTLLAVPGVFMGLAAAGVFSADVHDWGRFACCFVINFAGGLVAAAAFAAAPALAYSPAQIGTVNGILVQTSNLALFVGPLALAAVVSAFGAWESAIWLMVGANVVLVACALPVRRLERALAAERLATPGP